MPHLPYDAAGYPAFPGGSDFEKQFSPNELNSLHLLFDDCRAQCHLAIDSDRARILGRALIRLYSQGQHDSELIQALLVPAFKRGS